MTRLWKTKVPPSLVKHILWEDCQSSKIARVCVERRILAWYIKIILHRSMRTQTKNRVICIIASNNQHILIMIITTSSSNSPRQCLACEGGWCTWRQVLLGATQNAKGNPPEKYQTWSMCESTTWFRNQNLFRFFSHPHKALIPQLDFYCQMKLEIKLAPGMHKKANKFVEESPIKDHSASPGWLQSWWCPPPPPPPACSPWPG